jgi:TRAP-type transport system small permease protein
VTALFDWLERLLKPILAFLLAFITLGVFIQVVMRYVFAKSFLWGEELSLFSFIWCIYLGTAVTSWRHTHMSFDVLEGTAKGRGLALQRLFIDLCIVVVTVTMVWTGWQFSQLSIARLSPALGITLLVPTVIIPVAGALMTLVHVIDVLRDLKALVSGAPEPRTTSSFEPS